MTVADAVILAATGRGFDGADDPVGRLDEGILREVHIPDGDPGVPKSVEGRTEGSAFLGAQPLEHFPGNAGDHRFLRDGERERFRPAEDLQVAGDDHDRAGGEGGVFRSGGPPAHVPDDVDARGQTS